MRVIFCAYDRENYVGGPNVWLIRLLPDLRRQGIDAQCFMMTVSPPEQCPSLNALKAAGVPVMHTRYHDSVEERIHWLLACSRKNRPDVFIPNLVPAAYHAARWLREAGIPTVGVLHSDDRFYRDIADLFVFGRPEDRVDAMVCVSRLLENTMHGSVVQEIVHIGPSIEIPEKIAGRHYTPLRLMYAGRLVEKQKRISLVASMFCLAARTFPDMECFLYGQGPDQENVRRIIDSKDHSGRVHLVGRLNCSAMAEEMAKNHVMVMLSEYEGLPLALLEAMAQGLVPLCSRICKSGIPEVVKHEWSGLLIEEGEKAFLDSVSKLRDDRRLFAQLSANAISTVKDKYSMQQTTGQWIELFDRVLGHGLKTKTRVSVPFRLSLPRGIVHREDDRKGIKASLTGCLKNLTDGLLNCTSA